ncbi:holin [Mycobacteroides salmoniphilum]|uniref:holin n=1 Tax=Mycobacteroides salmoniphilum TaxID=404941 RepID=UPI000992940E|nr:holin [Mycobacteroides salmoniphilum]
MQINIPPWAKEFAVDAGERAAKTFAGGFIVGANLLGAAGAVATGQGTVALSEIDWERGLDCGAGTLFVSILFSLWSIKRGNPGTASATKAVVPSSLFKLVAGGGR